MLSHRTAQVTVGSTTITIFTQHGLPQGGGLSPILWSLVGDSLLSRLSKQGVFAQGYADHGCVLICGLVQGAAKKVIPSYFANFEATALNFLTKFCYYILCSYRHTIAKYHLIIFTCDKVM